MHELVSSNFEPANFEPKAGNARIAEKSNFLLLEASEALLVQELRQACGSPGLGPLLFQLSRLAGLLDLGIVKVTHTPMRDQCVLFQPCLSAVDGAWLRVWPLNAVANFESFRIETSRSAFSQSSAKESADRTGCRESSWLEIFRFHAGEAIKWVLPHSLWLAPLQRQHPRTQEL